MSKKTIFPADVEGVFIIAAVAKDTFFKRARKLEEITGFYDGTFMSYEEDEEGGCWKTIRIALGVESLDDLKAKIKKMTKYPWFFDMDCDLLIDGKEIYSGGRWLLNS